MISVNKKNEIVAAINREKNLLGSMNKVANKLDISAATISANIMKEANWNNVSADMWANIAASLGVSLVERNWNLVKTTNYRIVHQVLEDAQREAMFMAISEKAGSGKSAAIAGYIAQDHALSVYSLQCEEWSRRSFLKNLARELGTPAGKYDSCEIMAENIIKFFKQRTKEVAPLLILDEADKLKPSALRFLIPLYNRLEDEIGLVVCGTDNLKREIKRGVRRAEKGYDEIDSRLGRTFVSLVGSTRADVAAICAANGIHDQETHDKIFRKSEPTRKDIGGKMVEVVEDLRNVKRKIKKERLQRKHK